jgi:hypothetical protein
MQVFAKVTGQEDNIGDIVLRRQFLRLAGSLGELNLLSGEHSASFVQGLGCPGAIFFSNASAWEAAMAREAAKGPIIVFDKPGELQATWSFVRSQLKARLKRFRLARSGGIAMLLGVGMRHSLPLPKRLATRMALGGYKLIGWRDVRSAQELRIGRVVPDWAFAEEVEACAGPRDALVLSMRGDRPAPSDRWVATIKAFALRNRLSIVVVTQVGRDQERSIELAKRFEVAPPVWITGDYGRQEVYLRSIYRSSKVVVSDRMHILIVAAIEGAVPICLTEGKEEKIERHFQAIGFSELSFDLNNMTDNDVADALSGQLGRSTELQNNIKAARGTLDRVAHDVHSIIATRVKA